MGIWRFVALLAKSTAFQRHRQRIIRRNRGFGFGQSPTSYHAPGALSAKSRSDHETLPPMTAGPEIKPDERYQG
jgi:hypothetical protein